MEFVAESLVYTQGSILLQEFAHWNSPGYSAHVTYVKNKFEDYVFDDLPQRIEDELPHQEKIHMDTVDEWLLECELSDQYHMILSELLYAILATDGPEPMGTWGLPALATILQNLLWILEKNLRTEVYTLLEEGKADDLESLRELFSSQGPLSYTGAGIYMHVVIGHDGVFRLYIGQSINVSQRMREHRTHANDPKKASLRYAAVNSSAEDFWLLVARCDQLDDEELQPRLNIMEKWCTLCFQSLPMPQLIKYLPLGAHITSAGRHLNVASPIAQGYFGARSALKELRFSTDPLVSEYYRQHMVLISQKSHLHRKLVLLGNMKDGVVELTVTKGINIHLAPSLGLYPGDPVEVEIDVTDDRHPSGWAVNENVRPADPGLRLGIRIRGTNGAGTTFKEWATNRGEKAYSMQTR
ncbi:MAG: hypothetical protein M1812_007134 [Candelaria pacifica]|nr:MAG: hypothetical protein M1812_007134 [Candelaria pacifica]